MTAVTSGLQGAALIDFTGTLTGFHHITECGEEFKNLIRGDKRPKAVVIVDRAIGSSGGKPMLVRDHLNLTGTSPLLGPNDPIGERFPVVQGIYIEDCLQSLPRVVAAGIRNGLAPKSDDLELIHKFGADACCYHAVSAMLVAAHARCRVLAILLPHDVSMPDALLQEIRGLTGDQK